MEPIIQGARKEFDSVGLGGASKAGPGYFCTVQFLSSYLMRAKEKVQTYSILRTEFLLYRQTHLHAQGGVRIISWCTCRRAPWLCCHCDVVPVSSPGRGFCSSLIGLLNFEPGCICYGVHQNPRKQSEGFLRSPKASEALGHD